MVRNILSFGAFLLFVNVLMSADYAPQSYNQGDWEPGTDVGIIGGIVQYLEGGVNDRAVYSDSNVNGITDGLESIDATGATNVTSAIQAILNVAPNNTVVVLPSGTFRCDSTLTIGWSEDNITLRGQGMDETIIASYSPSYAFNVGTGESLIPTAGGAQVVSSSVAKGVTTLTIPSTTAFGVGYIGMLWVGNLLDDVSISNLNAFAYSVYGFPNIRNQSFVITSKTGSTITIWPPLPADYTGSEVRVLPEQLTTDFVGVEDLTIDCQQNAGDPDDSTPFGLSFSETYQCWAHNVRVVNVENYHLILTRSVRGEFRKCELKTRTGGGSNGAGLLCNTSSANLFEDNILYRNFPLIEVNQGSTNNVFSYNLLEEAISNTSIITNHGPHNILNLYEGNVAQNIKSDGYFGSASNETFYRNWIHGSMNGGGLSTYNISINRFTRRYSLIGNVIGWDGQDTGGYSFGLPNIGNGSSTGTAEPSVDDFWGDWKLTGTLTTRTSDTQGIVSMDSSTGNLVAAVDWGPSLAWGNGLYRSRMQVLAINSLDITFGEYSGLTTGTVLPAEGTEVVVYAGQGGYQELDLDVEKSTELLGNYIADSLGISGEIPVDEILGSTTLPVSLAYSGEPYWWNSEGYNLTFPPVNPNSPPTGIDIIPAGKRYLGLDPPEPPNKNSKPRQARTRNLLTN